MHIYTFSKKSVLTRVIFPVMLLSNCVSFYDDKSLYFNIYIINLFWDTVILIWFDACGYVNESTMSTITTLPAVINFRRDKWQSTFSLFICDIMNFLVDKLCIWCSVPHLEHKTVCECLYLKYKIKINKKTLILIKTYFISASCKSNPSKFHLVLDEVLK